MSIPVENVIHGDGVDSAGIQRNFDRLGALSAGFGGGAVEVRFGQVQLNFTASNVSVTVTVDHGLGRAPRVIVTGVNDGSAKVGHFSVTDDTFGINAKYDSSVTGFVIADWVAIG